MLIRSIRRQCVQAREHEAIVESRAEHEIKVIQTKLRSHIVTLEEKQFTVDETINAEKHCQQRLRDTIAQNVKKVVSSYTLFACLPVTVGLNPLVGGSHPSAMDAGARCLCV